jgi:hypothetical protein
MAVPDSNRATVATVDAKLDGLSRIIDMGLRDIQRQLDDVKGLPLDVRGLRGDFAALDKRVEDIERKQDGRGEWRRKDLPVLLIIALSLVTAIVFGTLQVVGHA